MTCSQYSYRSARPRIGPEPELVRVEVEPREPVVPVFVFQPMRPGVVRVTRRMGIPHWKRIAP